MSNTKQYGLILPKKANQGLVRPRPSVFNEDSDAEEESGGGATDWVKKALKREAEKSFQKKQNQIDMQKALEEDPTVYQYDEVYDKIEEKKAELKSAKKQDKKPRYIQSLLLQAEKRKREQERRNERLIQKEREAEGDMYKDKEAFVTSAYRQKLEEFKKMEEEERHQDEIEALTDVSKQKDLSGFYRHLYRVKMGETESTIVKEEKDCVDTQATDATKPDQNEQQDRAVENVEKSENPDVQNSECVVEPETKAVKRHYRSRRDSSASSDSNSQERKSRNPKPSENVDADSDFSVDSDSSAGSTSSSTSNSSGSSKNSSSGDSKKIRNKKSVKKHGSSNISATEKEGTGKAEKQKRKKEENEQDNSNKKVKADEKSNEKTDKSSTQTEPKDKEEVSEKKGEVPKQNIWLKRTVGEVFEKALQRYYERKSAKLANKSL